MVNIFKITVICLLVAAQRLVAVPIQSISGRPGTSQQHVNCAHVAFSINSTRNFSKSFSGALGRRSCHNISSEIPTTVAIDNAYANCRYNVVRYSGTGCQENEEIHNMNSLQLNFSHRAVKLNERKSVCSFKLRNEPLSGHPVTVTFDGGNTHDSQTFCSNGSRTCSSCYNLQRRPCENIHPSRVRVYTNGAVNSNLILNLYSSFNCTDDTLLTHVNGTRVRGEQNLEPWTRQNTEVVRSFLLE